MALILIVEDGSGLSNANTYVSLDEANTYHEAHLHASVWHDMTLEERKASLIQSTRVMDEQVEWSGWKATSGQALRYPRGGVNDRDVGDPAFYAFYGYSLPSNVVPVWLKNATIELARWLKAEDRMADPETAGYASLSVGKLSMTLDPGDRKSILPRVVRDMVSPYGLVKQQGSTGMVTLLRR